MATLTTMGESVHRMPTRASTKRRKSMNETTAETTPAYVPLTQFTLFPRLAPELRLEIFVHALPSVGLGHRMLRVFGEYCTKKPRIKNKSYIKFTLLNNVHSASVKDITLLSACAESREVFISKFHHSLHAGNGGLIRYADKDVVYIVNMHWLVNTTPILKPSRFHLLKELTMHNLALPAQIFYGEELNWGHQCPIYQLPYYTTPETADKYVPILLLKNLRVLAVVELDLDTLDDSTKECFLRHIKRSTLKAVKAKVMRALFKSMPCASWMDQGISGRKEATVVEDH